MPRSWPVAAKTAAIAVAGVNATDCIPEATAPCVPAQESSRDRRPSCAARARSARPAASPRRSRSCRGPDWKYSYDGFLSPPMFASSERRAPASPARAASRTPCSARRRSGSSCSARPRRRSSMPRAHGTSARRRASSPRAARACRESSGSSEPAASRASAEARASIQRASVIASAASRQTKHEARVIRSASDVGADPPDPRPPSRRVHRDVSLPSVWASGT